MLPLGPQGGSGFGTPPGIGPQAFWKPVPVDCGPDHLVDPGAIESAITPRTRFLMPVHLNGRTARMDAIEAIAAGTDLLEICHRADRVLATHEALLREAERSPAFARAVDEASKRVASAKLRLLKKSVPPRRLSTASLKQLQNAQERLRARIAHATRGAKE